MNVDQIVWTDPDRVGGLPCFTGTRVPVSTLSAYLDVGDSMDDFLEDFPAVSREQAQALLKLGAPKATAMAPNMRLLLDENLPRRLRNHLQPHDVATVQDKGWSGIKNGRLLRLAELEFDVLITIDSNMIYQQHVASFAIGLVVLHSPSNRLNNLLPLVADVLREVEVVSDGQVAHVGSWKK